MGRLCVHAAKHSTSQWLVSRSFSKRSRKCCVQIDEGENDGNCKKPAEKKATTATKTEAPKKAVTKAAAPAKKAAAPAAKKAAAPAAKKAAAPAITDCP